jgi:hypothetical protein
VDPARLTTVFRVDRRVFFTFVFYDSGPLYLHALGPELSHWDAVRTQQAAALAVGDASWPPALDRLRNADRWADGEMRAIFPSTFAWSVDAFCRNAADHPERARRGAILSPSPLIAPDGGSFTGSTAALSALSRDIQAAERAARQAAREAVAATWAVVREEKREWLRDRTAYLARFLACACGIIRACRPRRVGRFARRGCTGCTGRDAHWTGGPTLCVLRQRIFGGGAGVA